MDILWNNAPWAQKAPTHFTQTPELAVGANHTKVTSISFVSPMMCRADTLCDFVSLCVSLFEISLQQLCGSALAILHFCLCLSHIRVPLRSFWTRRFCLSLVHFASLHWLVYVSFSFQAVLKASLDQLSLGACVQQASNPLVAFLISSMPWQEKNKKKESWFTYDVIRLGLVLGSWESSDLLTNLKTLLLPKKDARGLCVWQCLHKTRKKYDQLSCRTYCTTCLFVCREKTIVVQFLNAGLSLCAPLGVLVHVCVRVTVWVCAMVL